MVVCVNRLESTLSLLTSVPDRRPLTSDLWVLIDIAATLA